MTMQRGAAGGPGGPGGTGGEARPGAGAPPMGPPGRRPGGGPGMMGMMGMPAAKAKDFKGSFRRLIERLRPERSLIAIVIVLAVISVAFAVIGPKILGNATNDIFAGVLSKQIPAGVTQEQVDAGLRAQGKDQLADMLGSMRLTPGQGVDFNDLANILLVLIGIYLLSSVFA
ncbi:MAG: ABC transporter ATP-binding protein, partial [Chloroflexota bacterium]